jgi:hypothetical protein
VSAKQSNGLAGLESIVALLIALESKYIVTTAASNWGRLIDELHPWVWSWPSNPSSSSSSSLSFSSSSISLWENKPRPIWSRVFEENRPSYTNLMSTNSQQCNIHKRRRQNNFNPDKIIESEKHHDRKKYHKKQEEDLRPATIPSNHLDLKSKETVVFDIGGYNVGDMTNMPSYLLTFHWPRQGAPSLIKQVNKTDMSSILGRYFNDQSPSLPKKCEYRLPYIPRFRAVVKQYAENELSSNMKNQNMELHHHHESKYEKRKQKFENLNNIYNKKIKRKSKK